MSLYLELQRRNVFRVAAAYAVAAWLLIQVAETIFPLFGFGDAPARIVVIVLAIGFVPAVIIAWAFEITPEGLKREADVDRDRSVTPQTGKKLDRITVVVLAVAVAYFAFDKFVLDPQRDINLTETAARAGAEQAREEARLDMFSDKSIAVLPFANRSQQQDDEYFTDGMHDELLTRLSRISALKVISRTSVMRYRGTAKSIPEIAKELSVATVLEGGVQRSGNHVRINVQLIDARTDEHLWAEIYDRELTAENLFAIQSEISSVIAESLEATLSPEERTRIYDLPTSSLDAYNHYLRGRQSLASRSREGLQQALAEFEKAADIDPEFALAWVGIADSVHLLAEGGAYDWVEHLERHRADVERALALDDQSGEAYASMAFVYSEREEADKAIVAIEKAIELNPNYAQAYHWYANILPAADREAKRLPLLLKAAQLDPLSSVIQLNIAGQLESLGRAREAHDVIDRLLELDPDFAPAYSFLANVEASNGEIASALRNVEKALELDPGKGFLLQLKQNLHIILGDLEASHGVLAEVQATMGKGSRVYWSTTYFDYIARRRFRDVLNYIDTLPDQMQESTPALWGRARAHILMGEFQAARDYTFRLMPFLASDDAWRQEASTSGIMNCEFAGAINSAGEDIGPELLQLLIDDYEMRVAGNEPVTGRSVDALVCYLATGSYEQALDILDAETAEGRLLDQWWYLSMLPWWSPLENNARYLGLVERIEGLLEEQRTLAFSN